MKKKKLTLWVLGTLAMITLSAGITWAFFSYVRTGDPNVFRTGNIYFNSEYTGAELTNVFPINKNKVDTDTENVMEVNINIEGYTSYEQGVDYTIKATDVSLTAGGKNVPINAKVSSENVPNIQTYSFEEEMVVVDNAVFAQGNILPEDGNVDGTVTIKAYIDKNNVVISDTYDGTESDQMGTTNDFVNGREVFTTSEWNALENTDGVSFRVKVEAWEHEETLYDVMQASAVMDNIASEFVTSETGIDFSQASSGTNGKGLYKLSSTAEDKYPVVYYRGAVQDNNVLFGGFCWKAVRTTETGGVKLIYNGEPGIALKEEDYIVLSNTETNPFVFDANTNTWRVEKNISASIEMNFKVPSGGDYEIIVHGTTPSNGGGSVSVYKDGVVITSGGQSGGKSIEDYNYLGDLTSSSEIKVFLGGSVGLTLNFKVRIKDKTGTDCANTSHHTSSGVINPGEKTSINSSDNRFNLKNNSYAYVGYMYNKVYENKNEELTENAYFGSTFIYENDTYKLKDVSSSMDEKHHYTCNSDNMDIGCKKIRYYYTSSSYIELEGGININDAINEMLYSNDVNKYDSNAKKEIELWYKNNIISFTNMLEDATWCNDRSVSNLSNNIFDSNVYFKDYDIINTSYNVSFNCTNSTDRFRVGNNVAKLKYPVGLLNASELLLAGLARYKVSSSYLNNGMNYWSMSPGGSLGASVIVADFWNSSSIVDSDVLVNVYFRPSISLAFGATIEDGDGTVTNPYVINGK